MSNIGELLPGMHLGSQAPGRPGAIFATHRGSVGGLSSTNSRPMVRYASKKGVRGSWAQRHAPLVVILRVHLGELYHILIYPGEPGCRDVFDVPPAAQLGYLCSSGFTRMADDEASLAVRRCVQI